MDPIESIFKKKDLLWQFLLRNVKQRHRGSLLGALWLIVNPLLMLCLYVFAFGIVFGGRFTDSSEESTLDYALGVFLGLSTVGLVSGTIGVSPGIIVSQPNFVKKVVFPLEILPTAMIAALSYDLLIGLGLCLAGICFLGPGFSISFFLHSYYHRSDIFNFTRTFLVFFCTRSFYTRCKSFRVFLWLGFAVFKWCILFGN